MRTECWAVGKVSTRTVEAQQGKRMTYRILVLLFGLMAVTASAHLGEDLIPLQLVATQWASAAQSVDREALAAMTTDDFTFEGRPKEVYLATLSMRQITRVELKNAVYSLDGDRATVSPVVFVPYREMDHAFGISMQMVKVDGDWRLQRIDTAPLPDEWETPNHMLHHAVFEARVSLRDADTGQPVFARVSVRDASGEYWPPQGHRKRIPLGWRADVGGAVHVAGQTWAYVKPDFKLSLPAGDYTIQARRGLEYEPAKTSFRVTEDGADAELRLSRWVHMAERGWYSGDTHTHFLDPHYGMLEAQGEDVNVVNVLASSGGNLSTQIGHFTGQPSVLSTDRYKVYIGEETRHDFLGHTVLLNLKELVFPFGWGPPLTGVRGGSDYPTMAHQADKAHAQGGLVAWSHFPHPHGELPIDVALGKVDAVETFVFGTPFESHPARIMMGKHTPKPMSPLRLWYALLNTGYNLPAVGGTDKMWNTQVTGAVRTYVNVVGEFSYQSWIDGIQAGRNFVSTGAMIDFAIGSASIGDRVLLEGPQTLPVNVRVESRHPVDHVEVIVNGEVVLHTDNSEKAREVLLTGVVALGESAWVAARAYSEEALPTQAELTGTGSLPMAHTSPVYFDLNGTPRASPEDSEFLASICQNTVDWAKNAAIYHTDQHRAEAVALYEKGCRPFVSGAAPP